MYLYKRIVNKIPIKILVVNIIYFTNKKIDLQLSKLTSLVQLFNNRGRCIVNPIVYTSY